MVNIFVTGATGFLGWNIVKELLKDEGNYLFLLARGSKDKTAHQRIDDLLTQSYSVQTKQALQPRITVIPGDITDLNLGISTEQLNQLTQSIDNIFHCAALCEFGVPLAPLHNAQPCGMVPTEPDHITITPAGMAEMPGASFADVTAASTILVVLTALSASLPAVIEPSMTVFATCAKATLAICCLGVISGSLPNVTPK